MGMARRVAPASPQESWDRDPRAAERGLDPLPGTPAHTRSPRPALHSGPAALSRAPRPHGFSTADTAQTPGPHTPHTTRCARCLHLATVHTTICAIGSRVPPRSSPLPLTSPSAHATRRTHDHTPAPTPRAHPPIHTPISTGRGSPWPPERTACGGEEAPSRPPPGSPSPPQPPSRGPPPRRSPARL